MDLGESTFTGSSFRETGLPLIRVRIGLFGRVRMGQAIRLGRGMKTRQTKEHMPPVGSSSRALVLEAELRFKSGEMKCLTTKRHMIQFLRCSNPLQKPEQTDMIELCKVGNWTHDEPLTSSQVAALNAAQCPMLSLSPPASGHPSKAPGAPPRSNAPLSVPCSPDHTASSPSCRTFSQGFS